MYIYICVFPSHSVTSFCFSYSKDADGRTQHRWSKLVIPPEGAFVERPKWPLTTSPLLPRSELWLSLHFALVLENEGMAPKNSAANEGSSTCFTPSFVVLYSGLLPTPQIQGQLNWVFEKRGKRKKHTHLVYTKKSGRWNLQKVDMTNNILPSIKHH